MRVYFSLAASLAVASARLLHSLPEDTYAFPKFRVSFLNGLPVVNDTAQRWLQQGLRGGELEFLDQPWNDANAPPPVSRKEIGAGQEESEQSPDSPSPDYSLELMKMGPRDSYLCLIPKPLENTPSLHNEDSETDVTPARSWSLLQPLTGTCLYHRQGWFTYSYCHNDEIRQFKEVTSTQARFTGANIPQEDPEWDAYTLGRAPRNPEPGADLTVAEQTAQAANLELARNAGSRYLVQRWDDGTICDRTGKPRQVEVQFHCSMQMTDHILFVKETKTCSYVLVVHTPRLCGEPGFKSRHDIGGEAEIRCRAIVETKPDVPLDLPTADHPVKHPLRKTVLPPPPVPKDKSGNGEDVQQEKAFNTLLRKALGAIMGPDGSGKQGGDVIIDLDESDASVGDSERLVDILRAVGFNVEAEVIDLRKPGKNGRKNDREQDKKKKESGSREDTRRDEL